MALSRPAYNKLVNFVGKLIHGLCTVSCRKAILIVRLRPVVSPQISQLLSD